MEQPVLAEVSKLTFGIYLVHIFIMRYLLWKWDIILGIYPYWFQIVTFIIFTFAAPLIISYLISLFPFAKYLISYQRGWRRWMFFYLHTLHTLQCNTFKYNYLFSVGSYNRCKQTNRIWLISRKYQNGGLCVRMMLARWRIRVWGIWPIKACLLR